MRARPVSASPAPLPDDVSPHRLRKALERTIALLVVVVAIIVLVPGLGDLRSRFAHASPQWVAIGIGFEILSVLSYIPAFRAVFCRRMSWSTSTEIALSEQGVNSLLPVGGAGGLALGVWALRRGGMATTEIASKTVAFFLLTSLPNVLGVVVLGVGLGTHLFGGHVAPVVAYVPAGIAAGAIAAGLLLGPAAGRLEGRLLRGSRPRPRWAGILRSLSDGIAEARHLLARGDLALIGGVVGYMVFDILVLWASFRAFGHAPNMAVIWIAYLLGQLGNLVPLPGGVGGVEGGLIGALLLYGASAVTATAAVLLYRVIELWIPAMFGLAALPFLRRRLADETRALALCQPGDTVEIIGSGRITVGGTE